MIVVLTPMDRRYKSNPSYGGIQDSTNHVHRREANALITYLEYISKCVDRFQAFGNHLAHEMSKAFLDR